MKKTNQPQLFNAPTGTQAALFFLEGEYQFQAVDGGLVVTKNVSPAAVKQAFSKEAMDSGWLPANVNRCGVGSRGWWMVRWHAPAIYTLKLDTDSPVKEIRVALPALVWFGQGHAYYIWAMKGNRFDPQGELFRAPISNVDDSGLICFGKNKHPDVAKGGFEQSWQVFWEAPFNDHNDDKKSLTHPTSIVPKLVELSKSKARKYPVDDLIPMKSTLDAAINRMINRKERA